VKTSVKEKSNATAPVPASVPVHLPDLGIEWEVVTPEMAEAYLGKNIVRNRHILPRKVRSYAHDMEQGKWRKIGDPLRFDINGNLIDGQHRLHAIVVSKLSIAFPVIRGLDPDDIHVIDTGKARSPGDMLKISGYDNGTMRASALRAMLHIKSGPVTQRAIAIYTHADILDAAERHPGLTDSCKAIKVQRGIRPSMLAAMHYITGTLMDERELADSFINVIAKAVPTYEGDAAHKFREKLLHAKLSGSERMTEVYSLRAIIHTWNLFANKRPMLVFRIPESVVIEGFDTSLI